MEREGGGGKGEMIYACFNTHTTHTHTQAHTIGDTLRDSKEGTTRVKADEC